MRRPPGGLKWLVFVLATLFFLTTLDKWSHQWHFVTRDSQEREYYVDLRDLRRDGMKVSFTLLRREPSGGLWRASTRRRFELDYAGRRMVALDGEGAEEVIAPGSVAEKLYLELGRLAR